MRVKRKRLVWTGPVVGGLVLLFATMLQSMPAAPEPKLPGHTPPGGQVVADDELPISQPFNHTAAVAPAPQVSQFLHLKKPVDPPKKQIAQKLPGNFILINDKEYPLRTYEPFVLPNDPNASQWWVTNTKVDQAWDVPAGADDTVLAIIDSGFGLGHEEFTDRWFVNPGESGTAVTEAPSQLNCTDRSLPLTASCNLIDDDGDGEVDEETGGATYQNPSRLNCTAMAKPLTKDCNRVDDDSNDFIDDVSGWDFANQDNLPQAGELNPLGSGTTHGTQVAGVAAATGNNSKGIAGVDWHTKILPIQALDDDSYGDTYGVGRAILYAAAMGADVINLSLGSELPDDYVREAVQLATAAGSVVVAASGNDGCNCVAYPANYPEVVSVGALDTNGVPAIFSSYGSNLDILAPGTQIRTPTWASANTTGAYVTNVAGTSFAAPLVSGILTRLLSQRPAAVPLQLIASLTESTNRLTLSATTSRAVQVGYGAVDAAAATNRMTVARTPAQANQLSPVSLGNKLAPGFQAETPATYRVQQCDDGRPGSTPLFQLTKSGSRFYSVSQAEVGQAQLAGWQATLFSEACLQQPHDVASSVRLLDIFKEFRNEYTAH